MEPKVIRKLDASFYDKDFRVLVPEHYVKLYFADVEIKNNDIKNVNIPECNFIIARVYIINREIHLIDINGRNRDEWLSESGCPLQDVEIIDDIKEILN